MKRADSKANALLAFLKRSVEEAGRFPTNREISQGADVMPWRVGSMLSNLVRRGDLLRTQIAAKGSISQPKYRNSLAIHLSVPFV